MIGASWRSDLDALRFPVGDGRFCFVHRGAFRTLLGAGAAEADCLAFFAQNAEAFLSAASARPVAPERLLANFHLTSRDVKRAIVR